MPRCICTDKGKPLLWQPFVWGPSSQWRPSSQWLVDAGTEHLRCLLEASRLHSSLYAGPCFLKSALIPVQLQGWARAAATVWLLGQGFSGSPSTERSVLGTTQHLVPACPPRSKGGSLYTTSTFLLFWATYVSQEGIIFFVDHISRVWHNLNDHSCSSETSKAK